MPDLYACPQLANRIAVLMDDPDAVFDREIIDHAAGSVFLRCGSPAQGAKLVEKYILTGTLGSNLQVESGYALPDAKEASAAQGAVGTVGLPERSDLEGVAGASSRSTVTEACHAEWSDA